jgi:TonB family protein
MSMPQRLLLIGFLLALTSAGNLFCQTALYVLESDRDYRLVRAMEGAMPQILEEGKLTPVRLEGFERVNMPISPVGLSTITGPAHIYKLAPSGQYLPVFVTVTVLKAQMGRAGIDHVHRSGRRFYFTARFASDYTLKNVFFALEFNRSGTQEIAYAHEVSARELLQQAQIAVETPVPDVGDISDYKLHVFSEGVEVFHSDMPRAVVEETLAKMAATRIAGQDNASAKPLTGPMPHYPTKLAPTKISGHAVVTCVIAANGKPTDVKIKTATNPAFAEMALTTMEQWWFVPRVEHGRAVASAAELPFDFTAPRD